MSDDWLTPLTSRMTTVCVFTSSDLLVHVLLPTILETKYF